MLSSSRACSMLFVISSSAGHSTEMALLKMTKVDLALPWWRCPQKWTTQQSHRQVDDKLAKCVKSYCSGGNIQLGGSRNNRITDRQTRDRLTARRGWIKGKYMACTNDDGNLPLLSPASCSWSPSRNVANNAKLPEMRDETWQRTWCDPSNREYLVTSVADRCGKSNTEQREGERERTVEVIMMSVMVGAGIRSSRGEEGCGTRVREAKIRVGEAGRCSTWSTVRHMAIRCQAVTEGRGEQCLSVPGRKVGQCREHE